MAVEVYMPKMSDHMEFGEIVRWLVDEGDEVQEGQAILEVESDKALVEFEAPASGILIGIREGAIAGAIIPVGETFAFIANQGEKVPTLPPLEGVQAPIPVVQETTQTESIRQDHSTAAGLRASPLARRTAKELGVDINQVMGTGTDGRITAEDVEAFFNEMESPSEEEIAAEAFSWTNLTATQRTAGARMLESVHNAPQFTVSVHADMAKVLALREELSTGGSRKEELSISVTSFLIKAVATSLRRFPIANASFDAGRLKVYANINIGVAVASEEGLVVPVVKNADKKNLIEIAQELRHYRELVSRKGLSTEDLTGGTFTVSNLGMHGIDTFQAIINPPECGILAVGRINQTPVCLDGDTVEVRPMMNLTLTIDHRCMDGYQGARFLAAIKDQIEDGSDFREGLESAHD